MKKIAKKNQIVIATLAVMIAAAGYMNYSGKLFPGKTKTQETKIQNRRKNKMAGGPGSYVLGAEERKEVLDVLDGGNLFRCGTPGVDGFQAKVVTFENEMAERLGHKHVVATL